LGNAKGPGGDKGIEELGCDDDGAGASIGKDAGGTRRGSGGIEGDVRGTGAESAVDGRDGFRGFGETDADAITASDVGIKEMGFETGGGVIELGVGPGGEVATESDGMGMRLGGTREELAEMINS
jgi:hypothetical protein